MSGEEYSVDTAQQAAGEGTLAEWVSRFLASPGSDNAPLGQELTSRLQNWVGPVELPIDRLNRLAGPPGQPVLEEVPDDYWRPDVEELAARIRQGQEPPPVIVSSDAGKLTLEDGNHRLEALRRAGRSVTWAIVGFEDLESWRQFLLDRDPDDSAPR